MKRITYHLSLCVALGGALLLMSVLPVARLAFGGGPEVCYEDKREVSCTTPWCMCKDKKDFTTCTGMTTTWNRGTLGDANEFCENPGDVFRKDNVGTCGAAEVYPSVCVWNAATSTCDCLEPDEGALNPANWVPAGGGWTIIKNKCNPC